MNEQKAATTLEAERGSFRRLGSLRACLALGCADIGTARLPDGTEVYCSWGRNLDRLQQEWFNRETSFNTIHLGADDGSAEVILPNDMAAELLPLLS